MAEKKRFDLADVLKNVSESDTFTAGRERIEYIKLDLIDGDEKNFYATEDIEALARNIATVGLLDPLRIRDNPDAEGRFTVVSGHRRRLALKLLEQDDPAKWGEVACIHEATAISPALQQLRLIFANADTRKMKDADISEQAAQVKELLYKLQEEEGYEFPGRMRDHVAEIVKISKSKLARLEVIRKDLAAEFQPAWKSGTLTENAAYELSKIPKAYQSLLFEEKQRTNANLGWLYADDVKRYAERVGAIVKMACKASGGDCSNCENKIRKAAVSDRYGWFHCDNKCCRDCPELLRCQRACPKLKETIKQLKTDAKESEKQEAAARAEKDRPTVEKISAIWQRFGFAREMAFKEIDDCKEAMNLWQFPFDAQKTMQLECGEAKITTDTKLPFGYSCYFSEISRIIALADLFNCSVDWLLCRTDVKEMALEAVSNSGTEEEKSEHIPCAWYPATIEPPIGKSLVLIDRAGIVDEGRYRGFGEFDMDYGSPVKLWTYMPDGEVATVTAPVVNGWRTGTPEAYGTYVAYVRLAGCTAVMLRELLWDGEDWFLLGQKISNEATIQCWSERPDF